MTEAIRQVGEMEIGVLPKVDQVVTICYEHLNSTFDKDFKGFGKAPKFPKPGLVIK